MYIPTSHPNVFYNYPYTDCGCCGVFLSLDSEQHSRRALFPPYRPKLHSKLQMKCKLHLPRIQPSPYNQTNITSTVLGAKDTLMKERSDVHMMSRDLMRMRQTLHLRLDKLLYVGPCEDRSSQLSVITALTRKLQLASDLNLEEIVSLLPDCVTGAQISALCSAAWLSCARQLILDGSSSHATYRRVALPRILLQWEWQLLLIGQTLSSGRGPAPFTKSLTGAPVKASSQLLQSARLSYRLPSDKKVQSPRDNSGLRETRGIIITTTTTDACHRSWTGGTFLQLKPLIT
ncbi:peroxisomal assembly protein [Homalodisca vitripennis]|nr:peroxisomal assembly protein [Homalodisca vitripennis]